MTNFRKRCPYRYFNHLANTSYTWDNRCKLEEGHEGEHIEGGSLIPTITAQNTQPHSGWIKVEE